MKSDEFELLSTERTSGEPSSDSLTPQCEQFDISDLQQTQSVPAVAKQNEWTHIAALLLADIVGTGVLALAGAFAKVPVLLDT